jgi:uncharacterized membrane protein YpjA
MRGPIKPPSLRAGGHPGPRIHFVAAGPIPTPHSFHNPFCSGLPPAPVSVWALLHRFKTDWRFAAPLLVANAIGMGYGWYYYFEVGQFDLTSRYYTDWWWWPLVADSPNAVLLFFVSVLVFKLTGRRSRLFDSLALTLNLYVGLWTTYLFLSYPDVMGTFDWGSTNNILFFTHIGMPLQALVLVHDLLRDQFSPGTVAFVLAFLAFYIYVDYWGPHLHPAPFLHDRGGDRLLHLGSPWLMVASAAAWLAVLFVPPKDRAAVAPDEGP